MKLSSKRISFAAAVLVASVGMAAMPAYAIEGTSVVTNAAPAVTDIRLYIGASAPTVTGNTCPSGETNAVAPLAGGARTIYVCAVITDLNGFSDVCSAGTGARTFNVTTNAGVSQSDAGHLKDSVALLCAGTGSGTTTAVLGSFQMEHWRAASSTYEVRVTVSDVVGGASPMIAETLDWTSLSSITASTATLDFGSLAPGATSTDSTVSITNTGNTNFNVFLSSTTFTRTGASIPASSVGWANAPSPAIKTDASATPANTGVVKTADTSDTPGAGTDYFLALRVPSGTAQYVPGGTYTGTITFSTS